MQAYAMRAKANPMPTETALWERIRYGQLGVPFEQQVILLRYRVDFFCERASLIVEVDGSSHDGREIYDANREHELGREGYAFLHLPDTMDLDEKLRRINAELTELEVMRDPYPEQPESDAA